MITANVIYQKKTSKFYFDRLKKSASKYDINLKYFEAITPVKLNNFTHINSLPHKFIFKNKWNKQKDALPYLRSIFLSHYLLWEKCLSQNQGLFIVEEDIEFVSKLEPLDFYKNYDVVNFHFNHLNLISGGAYYLYPPGAKLLIKQVKLFGWTANDYLIRRMANNLMLNLLQVRDVIAGNEIHRRWSRHS